MSQQQKIVDETLADFRSGETFPIGHPCWRERAAALAVEVERLRDFRLSRLGAILVAMDAGNLSLAKHLLVDSMAFGDRGAPQRIDTVPAAAHPELT